MKYLLLILLVSCANTEEIANINHNNALDQVRKLVYVQDKETNLCFASYEATYTWGALTVVPCSEEVLKKVINK